MYQINAKAEGEGTPTSDQVRLMLQTLLVDRLQLKLHREIKTGLTGTNYQFDWDNSKLLE
jgi:uncharacterized protein (TIGR03435 family)